jgi:kumamolisin
MIRRKISIAALTASFVLTACGGHGASPLPSTPQNISPYTGPSSLASFTYGASILKNAQFVRPAKFARMGLNVAVRTQNSAGLVRYAQEVSNPKSAVYRHFLTPEEIGSRFGATQKDYTAAATYFAQQGLHVGGWPQRQMLFVAGTQANLEKAFGTKFGVYSAAGKEFVAPTTAPHFMQAIPVIAVGNLVNAKRMTNFMQPVRATNGMLMGYTPGQLRKAFDYTGAYAAGFDGTGVNVGIIGTGPIMDEDTQMYGSLYHVKVAPVHQVNVTDSGVAAGLAQSGVNPGQYQNNPGLQTPPPVTLPSRDCTLPDCNPEDGEAQLDTQQVAALAPGSNVLFYLAYQPGWCAQPVGPDADGICGPGPNAGYQSIPAIGIYLADDEIQQAIADNQADVLSLSYGGAESLNAGIEFNNWDPTTGVGPAEFAALTAEGIAVFVSSGDSGAQECANFYPYAPNPDALCVSYPAADLNVTSVGGVTAPMDQFGNLTAQMTGWGVQTQAGNPVGSGGGVSDYFPQPSWQQGIPGILGSHRNQPDVSLLADNYTGVAVEAYAHWGGQNSPTGGTSVAAPQMAAMWALVVQACKKSAACTSKGTGTHPYRLGNAAPLFYQFYGKSGTNNPQYASVFQDVLYGDNSSQTVYTGGATPPPETWNQGYHAGPGYDLVTGLGVPYALNLIKAVTGWAPPSSAPQPSPSPGATTAPITIH